MPLVGNTFQIRVGGKGPRVLVLFAPGNNRFGVQGILDQLVNQRREKNSLSEVIHSDNRKGSFLLERGYVHGIAAPLNDVAVVRIYIIISPYAFCYQEFIIFINRQMLIIGGI